MTQAQAIERGFTHFIEVWRSKINKQGVNDSDFYSPNVRPILELDFAFRFTKSFDTIYTVCIFLIKPKQ